MYRNVTCIYRILTGWPHTGREQNFLLVSVNISAKKVSDINEYILLFLNASKAQTEKWIKHLKPVWSVVSILYIWNKFKENFKRNNICFMKLVQNNVLYKMTLIKSNEAVFDDNCWIEKKSFDTYTKL